MNLSNIILDFARAFKEFWSRETYSLTIMSVLTISCFLSLLPVRLNAQMDTYPSMVASTNNPIEVNTDTNFWYAVRSADKDTWYDEFEPPVQMIDSYLACIIVAMRSMVSATFSDQGTVPDGTHTWSVTGISIHVSEITTVLDEFRFTNPAQGIFVSDTALTRTQPVTIKPPAQGGGGGGL